MSNPKSKLSSVVYVLVLALFLLSGLSSLIYQVVWTRLLVLVFGSTTHATSAVLGVFMGGLAAGSFVAGKFVDRTKRPLLLYGLLEGVIGLWALFVPFLFEQALAMNRKIDGLSQGDFGRFAAVVLLEATVILLIPTTCMGATLPLLAKFLTDSLAVVGKRVGTIYAINTLGAVVGSAMAGFFLLPLLGLSATTAVAAVINLLLFLSVLPVTVLFENASPDTVTDANKNQSNRKTTAVLWAFAVSGAIAMVYEVCWTRTLLMVIGSSTYAFTIMLSTFLTGIFFGSFVMARIADRIKKPIVWFGIFQLLVCLACLVSMQLLPYLPWWNLWLNKEMPQDSIITLQRRLLLSATILFPLTACLGATFPLVIKACTTTLENVGRSVGTVYSFNTVGAIIGALLAGFALIPWLGVEKTIAVSCAVNILIGTGLIAIDVETNKKRIYLVLLLGGIAAAAAVCVPNLWDRAVLLLGQTHRRRLRDGLLQLSNFQDWRNIFVNQSVVYYRDGPCSTVGVLFIADSKTTDYVLVTNGCVDAGDGPDMLQQVTVGAYPMIWRPKTKDVCIVGWGSGVTAGEVLQFPINSIKAVELEPAVIESSYFFRPVNHLADIDKRVDKIVNDGRNYLQNTSQKFDLIVSEPSNPWQAGVCNLLTKEYFGICKDRLKPDGVLALWIQIGEVSPAMTRCILAALNSQYKYCIAITTGVDNMVVLASNSPLTGSWQSIQDTFHKNAAIQKDLSRLGINSPEAMLARIVCTSKGLSGVVRGAPMNTDDRNYLEYMVGSTYENRTFVRENVAMFDKAIGVPSVDIDWGELSKQETAEVMSRVAREAVSFNRPNLAYAWALNSMKVFPNEPAQQLINRLEASSRPQPSTNDLK